MSPRETIARTLFYCDVNGVWENLPDLHADYFHVADAVIDALEKMEVTEGMDRAYSQYYTSEEIWAAMVGAMRDE